MDKNKLIFEAYNRSEFLKLENPKYLERVEDFTEKWLLEDVGSGDITAEALLLKDNKVKAIIKAKSSGIIAGVTEAVWFYNNHKLGVKVFKKDGSPIKRGDIILELEGNEKDLFETERTGLNLLQRMSSIATLTHEMVEKIKGKNVKILHNNIGIINDYDMSRSKIYNQLDNNIEKNII